MKFPGLNLEALNDEEKEELKITLAADSYNISAKFTEILENFYIFLIEQPPQILTKVQIILSPNLKLPTIYRTDQYNPIDKDPSGLSIQDLSSILNRHCSFFNYNLLERIFSHINYEDGIKALKQHEKDLGEYAQKRISHFPSGVGIRNSTNYVIVAVKLDDMYEGCRIIHLLNFHKKLCHIL